MTAPAAITLPGSRALPGWWRELGDKSPRRFWFAHLILHRVEALVEVQSLSPLSALSRGVLAVLAHDPAPPRSVAGLASALSLEGEVAGALVASLVRDGLVETTPNGSLGAVTASGRAALTGGGGPTRQERRLFYFADTRPPVFLPLSPAAATPLPPPSGWRFELSALEGCLSRPAEWKQRHGFPADVVRLVWPRSTVDEQTWQTVPLDRPEQALLLLVETARDTLL